MCPTTTRLGDRILLEAVKRGFDYVDVEYLSGLTDVMVAKAGQGLILSHHDFKGTPTDLDGLYRSMRSLGADIVKIAVTPADHGGRGSAPGVRHSRGRAETVRRSSPSPWVRSVSLTRILGGRTGAPFTLREPGGRQPKRLPGRSRRRASPRLYRVREITEKTRVYGILGTDILRSLSPAIHNRAFAARGIDAVYVPLQADSLPAFLEALPHLGSRASA